MSAAHLMKGRKMACTSIPFVDASLNFLTWKCEPISDGCKNCYAKTMWERGGSAFRGIPALREKEALAKELAGLHPGDRVYTNGNTDTYHKGLPLETVKYMHKVISQRPEIMFLISTKLPEYVRGYALELEWPDNLWLGVSVESDKYLGRIDNLLALPAKHKFIAFEPLLGKIETRQLPVQGIDWVYAGGETGQVRRKFNQEWAAAIMNYYVLRNVPFYFKQGGGLLPDTNDYIYGVKYKALPEAFRAHKLTHKVEYKQGKLF